MKELIRPQRVFKRWMKQTKSPGFCRSKMINGTRKTTDATLVSKVSVAEKTIIKSVFKLSDENHQQKLGSHLAKIYIVIVGNSTISLK